MKPYVASIFEGFGETGGGLRETYFYERGNKGVLSSSFFFFFPPPNAGRRDEV